MDNKKKGLNILIIIVIVVIVAGIIGAVGGLGAFFVFNKVLSNGEKSSENTSVNVDNNEVVSSEENADINVDGNVEEVAQQDLGVSDSDEWKTAYANFLHELRGSGDAAAYVSYAFIYVDDNDIPELVLEGDCEATGNIILTYANDAIDSLQTARLYFNYIERQNLLCNSDGHMGYYYDTVYRIENGKWTVVGDGEVSEGADGPQFDENGDFIYEYKWNGRDVDMQEYNSLLNDVYDSSKAVEVSNRYSLDDMLALLEN